jgi:ABC-2 type transport system ATP-binding protein
MEISVSAEKLTKKFGEFIAVNNISFKVYKGEIYGFLGANGAGKTTTIRMLCGLLKPSQGDAFVGGISINENPEKVKVKIGYMSQKFSLYTNLTVDENIEFYAGIYGLKKEEIKINSEKIKEKIEIKEYEKILVSDLPAGIKQRVALACAIIHNPEIVFLDEPTAGVDPVLRKRFWEIIEELAASGKTVFVTTHYMDEVEHCTKIALMNEGRIVAEGKPEEIKKDFFKNFIYELEVDDVVKTYNKIIKEKVKIGNISMHGAYLHIITDMEKNELEKIIKENNIDFKELIRTEPTMEDVFIKLVRGG